RQDGSLPDHEPRDRAALGAEGETDSELSTSFVDPICHDAVHADARGEESDGGEDRPHHHVEPSLGSRALDDILHRPDVIDRLFGIDRSDSLEGRPNPRPGALIWWRQ